MISIVLITIMLAIQLFDLTQLCSFLGCYFDYLPIFIPYRFMAFNCQGLKSLESLGQVCSPLH